MPASLKNHLLSSGATYAASNGYDFLATINGGEGFWVNAKTAFTAQLPAGEAISASYFRARTDPALNKLFDGWNLIATGENVTPMGFNYGLSASDTPLSDTPPSPGHVTPNFTTLWAWDNGLSSWYFYAPSLDNSGKLASYITGKGYLDFFANRKTLGPAIGFWVNYKKADAAVADGAQAGQSPP